VKVSFYITAAALTVALFSSAAFSQQNTGGGPGPAAGQQVEKQMTPEQFSALKIRILKGIEVRQAKLSEGKACVEAATTPPELKKCRQMHPMHPMGPGQRGTRGQTQQPPAGQQQ
jgi:hypothetical protein